MKKVVLLACLITFSWALFAQTFEVSGIQDNYKGTLGELIKAPIRLKNSSEKSITLVVRRLESQIGSSQKIYFCPDNNCLDQKEELTLKLDPGQTIQNFAVALEAGLVEGFSSMRYLIYNKANPTDLVHFELNFMVESRPEKASIYTSRFITIHDVYPNPMVTSANIDYQLHQDNVKAKIVIHNILGNALQEYELPFAENRVKITADDLGSGIYFYTVYIDQEGLMTRKLIVRK